MRRDVSALAEREYDVVIVGGGIFGVCAAWDAVLRGLSVALIEQGDFAHATSANCFKIVHGGIRYLQHADLIRIRESNKERNALLRIAPHLVQPLPIVIPTYGHGMKGKEILGAGLLLYDFLTFDRNRGIRDLQRQIPRGRFISRKEVLEIFPHLDSDRLTGAAVIYDGQMYSPPRLALCFLKSAALAGAEAANYVEAINLCRSKERVSGVVAIDRLTGEKFAIRAKVVLNAAGPWAEHFLKLQGLRLHLAGSYSRDAAFVVARRLVGKYALAVPGKTRDPDAILSRQNRHLFLVPWRGYTMVGVWHLIYKGDPDGFTVTVEDLQSFIDEINDAYPALDLKLDDVLLWNAGLVLFGNNQPGSANLSYGKRSRIVDHATEHGIEGLVTLIGVRYTTARREASRAINLVFKKLGKNPPKCATATTPIYGGRFKSFENLVQHAVKHSPSEIKPAAMHALVRNHGSEYKTVLRWLDEKPAWAQTVEASTMIKAEVIHAVREEMAQKLGDVVFRRTDLGTGEYPGEIALKTCAELMAGELGWNELRVREEIAEVKKSFPTFCGKH
jgi:glycerol-3-phosphate dehydrogenase